MARKKYNEDGEIVLSATVSSDVQEDYNYDLTDEDWSDTEEFNLHILRCLDLSRDFSVKFSAKPIKPEREE